MFHFQFLSSLFFRSMIDRATCADPFCFRNVNENNHFNCARASNGCVCVCRPGIKPYKCSVCDKAFAQQANMVKHQMLHSGNTHSLSLSRSLFVLFSSISNNYYFPSLIPLIFVILSYVLCITLNAPPPSTFCVPRCAPP